MTSVTNSSLQWLGQFQQLFDSALPTGAYAHSYGLEGLVQMGEIQDMSSLADFVENEMAEALVHVDLPIMYHAYLFCDETKYEQLAALESLAIATIPTGELRKASCQIGRQTWKLYDKLLEGFCRARASYHSCDRHFERYPSVVIHGCLCACMEIPTTVSLEGYCRQQVINFIQPALKLLNTGPTEVQKMIHSLGENFPRWVKRSMSVELDETGTICPRWDIASARHETAERRLYIS